MSPVKTDPLVLNVIGAGHWAPNLIRNFISHPKTEVGIICDNDPEKIEACQHRFTGISTNLAAEEAINDPNACAIVIATPLSSHFELAEKALMANKHVLVEKPLAGNSSQCQRLIDLANEKERILLVGHVFKYNSSIRYVKKVLEEESLGKIISLHAQRTNLGPIRSDTNALWDLGAHDLSIFNYWLDSRPQRVTASGLWHLDNEFADTVIAHYSYPDDIMATLHTSWLHPQKVRQITIVGEKKMLLWDDINLNESVRIYDKGIDYPLQSGDTFGSFRLSLRQGDITIPSFPGKEPLSEECNHFINCILQGEKPFSDGEEGRDIVCALEAADLSITKNSQWVEIKS
ncbi:Gfo/Idh/MocA family protein [Candidatus Riflebacteria bacterium]